MTELDMVLDDLLENVGNDYLEHYGKGHDDNPPGRGSGRYAFGSGKNPKQHVDEGQETKSSFKSPNDLSSYMKKNFKYEEYTTLKSPEQTSKDKSGSCHDQTLFEISELRKMGKNAKGKFLIELDEGTGQGGMTHSFAYWTENGKTYYFENAWGGHEGIREAKNLNEILIYFWDKKVEGEFGNHRKYQDLEVGDFDPKKLKPGMNLQELVDTCLRDEEDSAKHSDDIFEDFLQHYGVGPDDDPPGRGSGRYAKGTGANPYQHDPAMRKRLGLFGRITKKLADRKRNTEIDRYRDYVDGMLNGALKNDKGLRDRYKELNDRTDGKLSYLPNGDPSYDGSDNDREKLAKEWKDFSQEVVEKHAKAEARADTLNKAREVKAKKEAFEKEKNTEIAKGNAEWILNNRDKLSSEDLNNAFNRIQSLNNIQRDLDQKNQARAQEQARIEQERRAEEQRQQNQKAQEEAKRKAEEEANRPKTKEEIRKEKFDKFMSNTEQMLNKASRVRDMAEKGIDIWNTFAAISNTVLDGDKEIPMVKRPDQYFREKADEKSKKLQREQQLEDAKTKRQNELADALRKEKREDEKWEKEQRMKYGDEKFDNVNSKKEETAESKSTETKEEPKKEKKSGIFDKFKKKDDSSEKAYKKPETVDGEFREVNRTADYDGESIARALLTSSPESRQKAAEAGEKFWMTVVNGGGSYFGSSSESNANYNRDRSAENKRYNEWESTQRQNAATRMKRDSEENDSTINAYANRLRQLRSQKDNAKGDKRDRLRDMIREIYKEADDKNLNIDKILEKARR